MITLRKLLLDNFMSISHLEMDFEDGSITSITGKNGSGKSALFYALAFAITGYKKSDSFKEYVRAGQEKASIYLEATFKGFPITYDISVKEKNGTVDRTVVYNGVTYHNSDYEAFIKEHELDQLENIMFVFQKANSITNAKPTERANMLKRLFKFEFDSIVNQLKEKLEESKTSLAQTNAVIEELNKRMFELQPLARAKNAAAIQSERDELGKISGSLNRLQNVDKNAIDSNLRELRKANADVESAKSKITFYQNQIRNLENSIEEKGRYLQAHDPALLRSDLDKMQHEVDAVKIEYEKAQEQAGKIAADIRFKRSKIKELQEQITIGEAGVCHACGQPVDQEHVDKIRREKAGEEVLLKELEKNLEDCSVDALKRKVDELEYNRKGQEKVLQTAEQQAYSLDVERGRLREARTNLEDRERVLETCETNQIRVMKERERLTELEPLLAKKAELEAQRDALEKQIEEDLQGIAILQEKIENNRRIEQEKNSRDDRVRELGEVINNTTKEMNSTKTAVEIYEKAFPNFCIMKACESIQNYINSVVQKLFPYMSIKLTASNRGKGVDFYYTSESSKDKYINAKMASGAQEQILNLAYSIAIAQAYGLRTILLDEVDAAMDNENCGIIYEFMTTLEGFDQVIFISHRPESLDVAKKSGATAYYVESGEYTLV